MKTFIWINGQNARVIEENSLQDAITIAENYSDHSKEIIVREISTIEHFSIAKDIPQNIHTIINQQREAK